MQSLIQEAATIEKAVAQAWRKAGQPQQFQIKILERPERNFLGMVTRSAKVAIMFNMKQVTQPTSEKQTLKKLQLKKQPSEKQEPNNKQYHKQVEQKDQKSQKKQREQQPTKKAQPESKTQDKQPEQPRDIAGKHQQDTREHKQSAQQKKHAKQEKQQDQQKSEQQKQNKNKRPQSLWTQERVQYANSWLRTVLDNMGYKNISFTVEPQNLYLCIELSDHLLTREDREKQLLASLASLMMATMQQQYKKAFRGHKVVLTHP